MHLPHIEEAYVPEPKLSGSLLATAIRSVWFVETGKRGPRFVTACAGFEVELATLAGETLAVVTVPVNAVRPVGDKEIAHVRRVA